MPINRDSFEQRCRNLLSIALCCIEIIQGLQDIAVDLVFQLSATQCLECVWWDAGGNPGFQHDAVFGSTATRHWVFNYLDFRILVVIRFEHRVRGFALTRSGPPVEDFQLGNHFFGGRDKDGLDDFLDLRRAGYFDNFCRNLLHHNGLDDFNGLWGAGAEDHTQDHQARKQNHCLFHSLLLKDGNKLWVMRLAEL